MKKEVLMKRTNTIQKPQGVLQMSSRERRHGGISEQQTQDEEVRGGSGKGEGLARLREEGRHSPRKSEQHGNLEVQNSTRESREARGASLPGHGQK